MLDSINFDREGIPAVAICSDQFITSARTVAKIMSIPDYRVAITAHPVGSLPLDQVKERAQELLPVVLDILTGASEREATVVAKEGEVPRAT